MTAYRASFDAAHIAARVVACRACARTLAWIDMLTLTQAGWTWKLSDDPNRLEWRCPECREPLIAVRDEPRAKRLEATGAPTLVQYARRLSRPRDTFGVVHDVELGNHNGDDPHALCGLGTSDAQQVMIAAVDNCKRCKRCARIRLEREKKIPIRSRKEPATKKHATKTKGGRRDTGKRLCSEQNGSKWRAEKVLGERVCAWCGRFESQHANETSDEKGNGHG